MYQRSSDKGMEHSLVENLSEYQIQSQRPYHHHCLYDFAFCLAALQHASYRPLCRAKSLGNNLLRPRERRFKTGKGGRFVILDLLKKVIESSITSTHRSIVVFAKALLTRIYSQLRGLRHSFLRWVQIARAAFWMGNDLENVHQFEEELLLREYGEFPRR